MRRRGSLKREGASEVNNESRREAVRFVSDSGQLKMGLCPSVLDIFLCFKMHVKKMNLMVIFLKMPLKRCAFLLFLRV